MDNVTHSLVGLALAQAGLNRVFPRATAILLVSANAPDLDIVALWNGPLRYLEVHRGYSHSLLFLPLMALIPPLLVTALFRQKLSWTRAWMLSCVGILSHLLLDWTNSYGIRLGLPFSSRWFHLDWNSLYDGFFLLVLVSAALWPLLASLVSREIGDRSSSGRGIAVAALVALVCFEGGRAVLHNRAVAQLQSRVYDGSVPLQVAALPDAFNPFRWQGVVETDTAYVTVPVLMSGKPDLEDARSFYKPPVTPTLTRLSADQNFKYFLYFARFPVWEFQPLTIAGGQGRRVDLTDLRFGTPGAGSFHCIALVSAAGEIVQSAFTYSSGRN